MTQHLVVQRENKHEKLGKLKFIGQSPPCLKGGFAPQGRGDTKPENSNIPQSNCLKTAICQPPLGKGALAACGRKQSDKLKFAPPSQTGRRGAKTTTAAVGAHCPPAQPADKLKCATLLRPLFQQLGDQHSHDGGDQHTADAQQAKTGIHGKQCYQRI